MTREEAIKILKGAIKKPNTKDGYLGQAVTMAIRSLEAWDSIEKEMASELYHGRHKKCPLREVEDEVNDERN